MTSGSADGPPGSAERRYEARRDAFTGELMSVRGRSQRLANLRLGTFAVLVVWLVLADLQEWSLGMAAPPGLALVGVFLWQVARHAGIKRRLARVEGLVAVNEEGIARTQRAWDRLPSGAYPVPADHPYAADLDLFGHGSLFQLLGTARTEVGRRRLAEWLLEPASAQDIGERQTSVRDLGPRLDFRQDLEIEGRAAGDVGRESVARFLAWATTPSWLAGRGWLLWFARANAVVATVMVWAFLVGALPLTVAVLPVLVNGVVTLTGGRAIHALFFRAGSDEASFQSYARIVGLIGDQEFEAPALRRVHELLTSGGEAERELARLHQLLILADLRFSMVWPILQGLFLWDVHVLHRVEAWRERNGRRVETWLEAVGDVEALAALAALAHDQPDWAMPALASGDQPIVRGTAVGHPLLADAVRVCNDVQVGPPGSYLLVTGSNMSGKSTLLRSIGVNVALAQAGGSVCARSFELPELRVWTSMRIQDSLEDGVSYFLASLRRLKGVVDAAREPSPRPLLYLLDEILQGTNSAERMVAVRRIISELVTLGAIGSVTTHDLELAAAPELASAAVQVHFRETIEERDGDERMTFDYRLRPGVASSTNALRLMKMIGLDTGE